MTRRRSDIEISAAILRVARGGARKSHIVYKANLNFKTIRTYLDRLRDSGLISGPMEGKRLYWTTEKGIEYLSHFEGFQDYINWHEYY